MYGLRPILHTVQHVHAHRSLIVLYEDEEGRESSGEHCLQHLVFLSTTERSANALCCFAKSNTRRRGQPPRQEVTGRGASAGQKVTSPSCHNTLSSAFFSLFLWSSNVLKYTRQNYSCFKFPVDDTELEYPVDFGRNLGSSLHSKLLTFSQFFLVGQKTRHEFCGTTSPTSANR